MPRLGDYLQYDDSSLIIWRDGSDNDPYIDKSDTLKIVNNRGVLDEIPDPFTRVSIDGMIEIDTKIYNAPKTPGINQYIVNYSNGVITFHPDMNGKSIVAVYKSRGKILIPATRVWVSYNQPDLVITLQDHLDSLEALGDQLRTSVEDTIVYMDHLKEEFIGELDEKYINMVWHIRDKIEETNYLMQDKYNDYVDFVRGKEQQTLEAIEFYLSVMDTREAEFEYIANEIMENIRIKYDTYVSFVEEKEIALTDLVNETKEVILYANEMGLYAYEKGYYAELQADRVDKLIADSSNILADIDYAIFTAEIETANAIKAANEALWARDEAIYARNTTILIWKPPIESFGQIHAIYPNPEIGWTTMTLNTGRRYRFNGLNWEEIDNFTAGAIPTVNEEINGLMSSEDFIKLKGMSGETSQELVDNLKIKTITFVFYGEVLYGNQGIIVKFPHNGILKNIQAYLNVEGATDTVLRVDKISESHFDQFGYWGSILNENLSIEQYRRYATTEDFINDNVNKNDYFRVYIVQAGVGAKDLTVQINISIKE